MEVNSDSVARIMQTPVYRAPWPGLIEGVNQYIIDWLHPISLKFAKMSTCYQYGIRTPNGQ